MPQRLLVATLLAVLLAAQPSSSEEARITPTGTRKATICQDGSAAKKVLTASPGYSSYAWYRVIPADRQHLEHGTLNLTVNELLEPISDPECLADEKRTLKLTDKCGAAKGFNSFVVEYTLAGARQAVRFDVDYVQVKPVIETSPEGGVEREDKLQLKTKKTDYKSWEWRYLGYVDQERCDWDRVKVKASKTGTRTSVKPAELASFMKTPSGTNPSYLTGLANRAHYDGLYFVNDHRECALVEVDGQALPVVVAIRVSGKVKDGKSAYGRKKVKLPAPLNDDKTTATVNHYPFFNKSVYAVTVKDKNGCSGTGLKVVEVDQHRIDFLVALDFARVSAPEGDNSSTSSAATMGGIEGTGGDESPDATEEATGSLFGNGVGAIGLRFRHYVRPFLKVYGTLRFSGTNVQTQEASSGNLSFLSQADAFISDFGLVREIACGPSTQVCFYGKGEYGLVFLSQDPDGDGTLSVREDLLDRSFFGLGWRYHKPGSVFHRSYTEFGFGRSDNFLDNSGRRKFRGAALLDLSAKWDLILYGELDSDGSSGADDLRVMVGVRRDLSEIGSAIVKALGFGDK
jgi:hypothetical protein